MIQFIPHRMDTNIEQPHWWSERMDGESRNCPLPDWLAIDRYIEAQQVPAVEAEALWEEARIYWVRRLCSWMGKPFRILESDHFSLISSEDDRSMNSTLTFLEKCFDYISQQLSKIIDEPPQGKCPVIVFASTQDFYEYVAEYIKEDGDYGDMGGVYLNRGYGHFATLSSDYGNTAAFSHELTHALIAHLDIPLWLNEALAMEMEVEVTGINPYALTPESIEKHRDCWTEDGLQRFWNGSSFSAPGDEQILSYELAHHLFRTIVSDVVTSSQMLRNFVTHARSDDAGASAAEDHLQMTLSQLVSMFLGVGHWSP